MKKRTNTTIEEVNDSIKELLSQWNVTEEDNLKIATKIAGLQLRKVRLMRSKSQTKVAKALSITFQQIQKYERGQNSISLNNAHKLCEYLNVSIDFWFKPLETKNLTFLKKRDNNDYTKQEFLAR